MKKFEIRAVVRDQEEKKNVTTFPIVSQPRAMKSSEFDAFGVYESHDDGIVDHVKDFPTYPLAVAFVLSQKRPFEAK